MKPFIFFVLFTYFHTGSYFSQNENHPTFQFVANGNFYKIDQSGKKLVGPVDLQKRAPYLDYYSVDDRGTKKYLYQLPGIEKLISNDTDTLFDIAREPKIMAVVKRHEKFGVIDLSGQLIIPAVYDTLSIINFTESPPFFCFKKYGKSGLLDMDGKIILPAEYDDIRIDDPFLFIRKDLKTGVFNHKGEKLTEIIYDEIGYFRENKCWIKKNGLYGFVDLKGNEIIQPKLKEEPDNFYLNYCEIHETDPSGSKYTGLMDSTGKIIIKPGYSFITINNNCFEVSKDGDHGLISKTGSLLLPLRYEEIRVDDETGLVNAIDKTEHFYLLKNKTLTPIAKRPEEKESGVVEKNKKFGIKNKAGKLIIPYQYEHIMEKDSTYFIYTDKKNFYISTYDLKLKPFGPYQQACYIEGYNAFLVQAKDKWGIIGKNGEYKISPEYESLMPYDKSIYESQPLSDSISHLFCDNVSYFYHDTLNDQTGLPKLCYYATKNGKTGVLDTVGNEFIPVEYDDMYRFYANSSLVRTGKTYQLIDASKKKLYPETSNAPDTMYKLFPGMYVYKLKNKYGLVKPSGKEILSPNYDSINGIEELFELKMYYAFNNYGCTVVDSTGNVLVRNCPFRPSNIINRFGILKMYGKIMYITDSIGKVIWNDPFKIFSAVNTGQVSNNLCILQDLEEVYFSGNDWDYNFSVPPCFYNLSSLKKISIVNADYDSIPGDIANLTKLHYLEIYSNKLRYLSPKLGTLQKLDTLIIKSYSKLPEELNQLNGLVYLETYNPVIPSIPSLHELYLNSFDVPSNLSEFTSLKKFNFSVESIRDEFGNDIPPNHDSLLLKIASNSSLEIICLGGYNGSWGSALINNAEAINRMAGLKRIELGYISEEEKDMYKKTFPKIEIRSTSN